MDDLDLKRLKQIGKTARKAKVTLMNVINDVRRWNNGRDEEEQLRPAMKFLDQGLDALMDLNNACTEREREHERAVARRKVGRS